MHNESGLPLVSCGWLNERLGADDVVILDASFFLPNQQRDAEAEYRRAHIPGARFFDIDAVADHATSLPHMLPSAALFEEAVGALGIARDTHVVVYDSNFFMASARAWWTFRAFGHDSVSVLDGGLVRWQAESRPTTDDPVQLEPRSYAAAFREFLVRDLPQMRAALADPAVQVIDARSPGRFAGSEAEPRAGLRSGHMPGSVNVFFKSLINDESRCLKPARELEQLFRQSGVDLSKALVTSCGTGVTAAILALGFYLIGNDAVAVYDGSWTEWGGCDDTPVVTGPT